MKRVPRTVSEVGAKTPNPRPLADYREEPALVLVGDAGSGKTTEFRQEREALAERGEFVTARGFINFGCNADLREKTLFIDGLDEARAGKGDPRTPLDAIVKRLYALRRPRFRLSCRALDLGRTDVETLERVSPNGSVQLVRLDPLRDSEIDELVQPLVRKLVEESFQKPSHADARALVEAFVVADGAPGFLEEARRRRLGGMLPNPQSLRLLLLAFARNGGRLPKSRREAFQQACLALAAEQNDQHLDSGQDWPDRHEVLNAASEVCALVLLSGAAGVRRHEKDETSDWAFLGNLPDHPRNVVEAAVGSALFKAASESHHFEPVHRVVAEFLAAQHLATRIEAGVPVRRLLRWMTVGSDSDAVPTPLRGLAAWLATVCPPARSRLIRCDPVGVAAYSDTTAFSTVDKERLLKALRRQAPEFGSWRFPEALVETLSGPDMEPEVINILESPDRDDATQVVAGLALRALEIGEPRPQLLDLLLAIVRDPARFPYIRRKALDASIYHGGRDSDARALLQELLDDLRERRVADDDRELSGTLLRRMYPTDIQPRDIWTCFLPQRRDLWGRDDGFWNLDFMKRTPREALPEVVEALATRPPEFWRVLEARDHGDLPVRVVARAVTECGDDVSVSRLYGWLRLGFRRRNITNYRGREAVAGIRQWMETRPDLLRELWREGIRQYAEPEDRGEPGRDVLLVLVPVGLPPEFGRFCLEQAVEIAPDRSMLAYRLLTEAVERSPAEGIPVQEIEERAGADETLARWLPEMLSRRPSGSVS